MSYGLVFYSTQDSFTMKIKSANTHTEVLTWLTEPRMNSCFAKIKFVPLVASHNSIYLGCTLIFHLTTQEHPS